MTYAQKRISRRNALKAAAVAVAAPTIVRRTVFGQDAPSDRMLLASIGTGRMGHGDMKQAVYQGMSVNARVAAVCDLDSNRAAHAKGEIDKIYEGKFGKGKFDPVKAYGNFREVLARTDINGVTLSLPDHQHALVGIAAANAKKDIYIQKPFTYSVVEGQKLVAAVRKNKVILQTGSQQRSDQRFRMACELVRNGHLGKVKEVQVGVPTDHGTGNGTPMPVPPNLNYDAWLGPTPVQPYTQDRVHPQKGYGRPGWLQIEAYCRGMITGWGAHMYDIAQWGLGTDVDSGPVTITAKAEFPKRGIFDVHTKYSGEAYYANDVKLTSSAGRAGVKFIGEKGWLWVTRGSWKAEPASILKEKIGPDEVHLYVSKNHMLNLLECMRTRKDPVAPAEVGHRSNTVCVLHHIAMKLGRKLTWDPKAEKFLDDAKANEMLDFPHRKPYVV